LAASHHITSNHSIFAWGAFPFTTTNKHGVAFKTEGYSGWGALEFLLAFSHYMDMSDTILGDWDEDQKWKISSLRLEWIIDESHDDINLFSL